MTGDSNSPDGFNGTARLFPLPNLVLFPGVTQGLHIFEPRYRQMMADAVASDSNISLVLLRPGWEETYDGTPEVEAVACLGRVAWHEKLEDGRYNLRLRGATRVRILGELPTGRPYRTARVEVIAETAPAALPERMALRKALSDVVLSRFGDDPTGQQLRELFESEMTLGQLCDVLAYGLPLPLEFKQAMLAEPDAGKRAAAITRTILDAANRADRRFPPDFSAN